MNPICPYCRTEVGDTEGERKDCPTCATPHHADCFAENGGCTVFGCASAPSDEAKVTVSATDMMGNTVTRQVTPQPAIDAPTLSRRPPLTLGRGFTTFQAPALDPRPAAPQPAAPSLMAPPPPPLVGSSGIAPPPQPASTFPATAPAPLSHYVPAPQAKTRVVFVLLGLFLGAFGIHNFYAGYVQKATVQLCITLLTLGYGAAISWPWAIVEVCVVSKDGEGTQFV